MSDNWPQVAVGGPESPVPPAPADEDPDDEELAETPADVILALGFDPLEEKEPAPAPETSRSGT